jgi:hypothetical protein
MGTISLETVADFKAGTFPEFLELSQANMCKFERHSQSETLLFQVLWRQGKPPGIDSVLNFIFPTLFRNH